VLPPQINDPHYTRIDDDIRRSNVDNGRTDIIQNAKEDIGYKGLKEEVTSTLTERRNRNLNIGTQDK
jgi:hypothetical protein